MAPLKYLVDLIGYVDKFSKFDWVRLKYLVNLIGYVDRFGEFDWLYYQRGPYLPNALVTCIVPARNGLG